MDSVTVSGLRLYGEEKRLLDGVSLTLRQGEILALVGASGSGKSLTARTILGLLPDAIQLQAGRLEVVLSGRTHRPLEEGFAKVRGALSYLPQSASTALDPLWTVARHLHAVCDSQSTPAQWLLEAGFTEPQEVLPLYSHELSGGMAQRVCIALALAQRAKFLIADEPTTGLDAPIQLEFLQQLRVLRSRGLGILLITHDIGLLDGLADRILEMKAGQLQALTPEARDDLRARQALRRHPRPAPALEEAPALSLRITEHRYRRSRRSVGPRVIEDAELSVHRGEVVGLIGESGSGKSTLARMAAGLLTPTKGQIDVFGTRRSRRTDFTALRRRVQILFQSADAHLNPGMTVWEMLSISARLHRPGEEPAPLVLGVLERVGLTGRGRAYPRQLSGGERRRVGIARVLLVQPSLLISDEPTSGLDAVLRADLLELLLSGAESHLIISHDLHLIAQTADRIAVMLSGRIIESMPVEALGTTHHPYTLELLGGSRRPEARDLQVCPFPEGCPHAQMRAGHISPTRVTIAARHWIACHHIRGT